MKNHRNRIKNIENKKNYINIATDLEITRVYEKKGVYIISILNKYYKIGSSKNIGKRIIQIERYLPFEIKIEFIKETQFYKIFENWIHRTYKSKKIKTEWYSLSFLDIYAIQTVFGNINEDYKRYNSL